MENTEKPFADWRQTTNYSYARMHVHVCGIEMNLYQYRILWQSADNKNGAEEACESEREWRETTEVNDIYDKIFMCARNMCLLNVQSLSIYILYALQIFRIVNLCWLWLQ